MVVPTKSAALWAIAVDAVEVRQTRAASLRAKRTVMSISLVAASVLQPPI